MKTFSHIVLSLCISVTLYASEIRDVKSEIVHVTVYRQGAQIERSLNVSLPQGRTDIYITGLSSKIDERSIQASAGNQAMIVSVNFSIDYLNQQSVSEEVELLLARRKQITDSIEMTGRLNQVFQQEREMIIANRSIGGNDGVSVDELKQTATFFRERLSEIEMLLHRNRISVERMTARSNTIARQLQILNAQMHQPTGVVKITVSAERAVCTDMSLTYVINDALWIPVYDIRIQDVDSPLSLFYKARVFQNTDEDWSNVRLTLSTGNPSLNNTKPELQTYFLTFNNFFAPTTTSGQAVTRGMLSGRVIDETGQPIPGVNVTIRGTNVGTVTNIDGRYSLSLPENAQMVSYSFIGFNTMELPIHSSVINVTLTEDAMMLDELVVVGYGGGTRTAFTGAVSGISTRASRQATPHVPLAIQQQQVSVEFQIDIPYTIPSNNQPYDVTMIEYQIPAIYRYSTVPKLSSDVFLMALIPDWTDYNLQNGEANLFFRGVFQGRTYIDTRTMEDTLSISIGRDRDIVVERNLNRDFQSRRIVGSNVREQRTWEITVRNNKNIPIRINIEDQFPISRDSDIRVEDLQHRGARVNETNGLVVWDLQIQPRSAEQVVLSYTVRYPRNRRVLVN